MNPSTVTSTRCPREVQTVRATLVAVSMGTRVGTTVGAGRVGVGGIGVGVAVALGRGVAVGLLVGAVVGGGRVGFTNMGGAGLGIEIAT